VVERIRAIPLVGDPAVRGFWRVVAFLRHPARFPGSASYWKRRYRRGGHSGAGSYGKFATFKAEVLNRFVASHGIESVIEFGCGDGNQLRLASYPRYRGFDVSRRALASCRRIFRDDASKSFRAMRRYRGERAALTLSLDVLYHLVEDAVFERYMRTLFGAAQRYVIIYSSNHDDNRGFEGTHVRHRRFTDWVATNLPDWQLKRHVPNRYPYRGNPRTGSFADFYIYERSPRPAA
jgi:hypothetical protein